MHKECITKCTCFNQSKYSPKYWTELNNFFWRLNIEHFLISVTTKIVDLILTKKKKILLMNLTVAPYWTHYYFKKFLIIFISFYFFLLFYPRSHSWRSLHESGLVAELSLGSAVQIWAGLWSRLQVGLTQIMEILEVLELKLVDGKMGPD